MQVSKWQRRATAHFGEVWVPFADVDIRDSGGRFRSFALQIDSGAVTSLLRRSAGELLGVAIETGRRIELRSVGGSTVVAYVHELYTRFGDTLAYPVPYAIAETESVPNLLGRRGVFDLLQVDFDASLQETLILFPWLDPRDGKDQRIYEFLIETQKHIHSRWDKSAFPKPAGDVVASLYNRMAQLFVSAMGLIKLQRPYAGALFVRSMFETILQLEYLLQDPGPRAEQYMDFMWVTKHLHSKAIAENPSGPISQAFAESRLRPEGEKRNKAAFDRVRARFLIPTKSGRTRLAANWYLMTTEKLAEALGRGGEYRLVYKGCSAWAHGDPSRTIGDPENWYGDARIIFLTCLDYYARTLLLTADFMKVTLTAEQHGYLEKLARGWS